MGVAEVVEADAGHGDASDLAVEELGDRFGVDRLAGGVGEYRIVEPYHVFVAGLAASPLGEHGLGVGVEVDAAATGGGLGGDLHGAAGDALAAAGDRESMG